ncbi:MAG: hypothetical protein U0904_09080 [Candidatus Nanopelagicales bacterium]|nr:hypothetical protein [Candidatus Nanopelagicales bacterium]
MKRFPGIKRRIRGSGSPTGTAARLAASVCAVSLVVAAVGGGAGAAADPAGAGAAGVREMFADWGAGQGAASVDGPLNVAVGKVVAASTSAGGESQGQGLYVATNVSGNGSATVKVPVGTDNPVDVNSISKLKTDGNSIVYDVQNSGGQVQQMIASAGQFKGQPGVTFNVEVKVNGETVDANDATSLTGDVELNYNFVNNTTKTETVKFKNAQGKVQKKATPIPVPFYVHLDGVFGKGWAALTAPWANSGFSTGQDITGGKLLIPSVLNKEDPNGTLTIKGRAENASLPAVTITATPKSTSGDAIASIEGVIDKFGPTIEDLLEGKALPMLLKVQNDVGKASGVVGKVLKDKVDPILDMLGKMYLDPKKADEFLEKTGKQVSSIGGLLLGVNATGEKYEELVAKYLAQATSKKTQATLTKVIAKLDTVEKLLKQYLPLVEQVTGYLDVFGVFLGFTPDEIAQALGKKDFVELAEDLAVDFLMKPGGFCEGQTAAECLEFVQQMLPALDPLFAQQTKTPDAPDGYTLLCDGGVPGATCFGSQTVGEIIDSLLIDHLDSTCTTGNATRKAWNEGTMKASFQSGIDALSGDPKANMTKLQGLLNKQGAAVWNAGACAAAGKRMEKQLDDILDNVGGISEDIEDLVPLVTTLSKTLPDIQKALVQLRNSMPAVRKAMDRPCPNKTVFDDLSSCGLMQALDIISNANTAAVAQVNEGVLEIVEKIEPAVNEVFGIANGVFKAAPHIKSTADQLPALISQLAYGTIGGFVKDIEDIDGFSQKLVNASAEGTAINKQMDIRFHSGEGFPYGSAEGGDASTQAMYTFNVAAPGGTDAPASTKLVFSIILLLLGAGLGTWLYVRAKPE